MDKERTNGETLIWVQSLKGYGKETLNSAKLFLDFDGDYRKLKLWKESKEKFGTFDQQRGGCGSTSSHMS